MTFKNTPPLSQPGTLPPFRVSSSDLLSCSLEFVAGAPFPAGSEAEETRSVYAGSLCGAVLAPARLATLTLLLPCSLMLQLQTEVSPQSLVSLFPLNGYIITSYD